MVEKVWGLKHVVNLHIRSDFASRNRIKDGLTKKKTTCLNTIKHDDVEELIKPDQAKGSK